MEYSKNYREIMFKISFSHHPHNKHVLSFAAQPYELLDGSESSNEPSNFLVYGKIGTGEHLEIGFTRFTFEITESLHERLGKLYDIIKKEYRGHIMKST